jgi:hypothetical protein
MVKVDVGNVYLDGKNVLKERSGNDDVDVIDTLVGDSGNE